MKSQTAKEIKKVLLGVVLSDGHIDIANSRFDFYSKHENYAKYVFDTVIQITGMSARITTKVDPRGYIGYRVTTKKHVYWSKMGGYTYEGRKVLTRYAVDRLDAQALAHIWMCDGYLEHKKNRKLGKIQNAGYLCLEAFSLAELTLLQQHLLASFGIECTLITVKWGQGYRIKLGAINLQRFISLVYPFILPEFLYKTKLFYKKSESADMSLPNARHTIITYDSVEDIVRHSKQLETT